MKKIKIRILFILFIFIIIFIRIIGTAEAATTTLAQTVINLSQGTTYTAGNGNGVYYTNSHEYRYVGGEVNNYVSFNNDLYRIIGVFDDYSTGVSGNLVKLIMARKLTSATWGIYNTTASSGTYSNYKNDWTGTTTGVPASANVILNEYFLNATDTSSTYGECINWTYGDSNNTYKSKNCTKIKGYGIQTTTLRNYIQPVTWYLYGSESYLLNKVNYYKCEKHNYTDTMNRVFCPSANNGDYSGTTTAKIGLMYVSDYLYASGYVASSDTSTLDNSSDFVNLNWLYNGNEWTITPQGDSNQNVESISLNGSTILYWSYVSRGIRPVFYLKSQVYVTGGNGSFHNPYTIACDTCNS